MGEGWGEGESRTFTRRPLSLSPLPQGARGFVCLTECHEGQDGFNDAGRERRTIRGDSLPLLQAFSASGWYTPCPAL